MVSRRNLLAAALTAPVMALPASAATLVPAATGPSAEWNAALAAMVQASERVSTFYRDVYSPHWEDHKRRVAEAEADLEERIAAVPHYETRQQITMTSGEKRSLSTAIQIDVLVAADFDRRRHDLSREDPQYAACCLELHPEAVRREETQKAMRESFVPPQFAPEIWDESERLEAESSAAWDAVCCFEADTLPDLVAKITHLKSHDCEIDHDELLADLARIFGEVSA